MSILGSCGAGKTVLCKYIISYFEDKFDFVFVITSTGFNGQYDFLDTLSLKNKVMNTIDFDKKIAFIMKKQKAYIDSGIKPSILIVFDDVMGSIKTSKKIKLLISTFRHYNINIIFISQYANAISTELRELCFYSCVFNQFTERSLKAVNESYFAHMNFKDFKMFINKKLSKPYTFMFVDRIKKKNSIMKAPNL